MDEVVKVIKVIILIGILILGALSAYHQHEKKNPAGIGWSIVGAFAIGILVNYISPLVIAFLPNLDPPVMSSYADSKNDVSVDTSETSEVIDDIPDSEDKSQDTEVIDDSQSSDLSTPDTSPVSSNDTPNSTPTESDDNSVETDNTDNYINQLVDITTTNCASGSINDSGQKDCYRYTALTSGTYRFGTDLSAGGEVRVRISGENNRSIDSGTNALTIDLEVGKKYILSIEYQRGPCDYTVNIGVPMATVDITGSTAVSGSITYQDQKDHYRYTAPTSGTYRFSTDLSAGGEVRVRISGENNRSIDSGTNALTIDLEAGKTYILGIEYRNGPCDYTVNIGVPIPISDISAETSISGQITFQDQKNRYYYTAPTSGTYRFDTNRSAGGQVRVRISGENGNSINYEINALTIDLEAGKTYILGIEYRNGSCDYIVNIGVPIPITDITGYGSASGNITYQDQKDKYYYTAPVSGTYCLNTNLSSGGEVRIRVSGENGNSLNYGTNTLRMNLEAGKRYILSVEYRNTPCSYTVLIEVQ
ncbi:MAG: hypothetical protein HDQ95_03935 [Roseburia sp.]|nr:hypothetical protein [Roseburia sp.]